MKVKVLIPVLLILITGLYAGNWIYGKQSASRIDRQLKNSFQAGLIPYDISYSKIEVNPLFSEFIFHDLIIKDKKNDLILESEKLKVKMKYAEALELSKTYSFEHVTHVKSKFDNISIKNYNRESYVNCGRVDFDFDGNINQLMYRSLLQALPTEKQEIYIKFNDLHLDPSSFHQFNQYKGVVNPNENINEGIINLKYEPENQMLYVRNFDLDSESFVFENAIDVKIGGLKLDELHANQFIFTSDFKNKKEISLGEKTNGQGFYTLKYIESSMHGSAVLDNNGNIDTKHLPEFNLLLNIKGLSAEQKGLSKGLGSVLSIPSDSITIDALVFQSQLKDGRLTVSDSKLESSLLNANLAADIKYDQLNPDKSKIESFEFRLSQIKSELQNGFKNIESMIGFTLPRDGDDIILELKGSLNAPKIKGVDY